MIYKCGLHNLLTHSVSWLEILDTEYVSQLVGDFHSEEFK